MERQTHLEKHNDREILTRYSLSTMKLVNWPGHCWRQLDTFSIRMSYLLLLKEQKMLRKISPSRTKSEGVRTQTMNAPVYIEAFEHQKNGVLLLSWTHSCAVRLHADESMSDESLPHVVQLSSIDPVQTQYSYTVNSEQQQHHATRLYESPTWKSIHADLSVALLAIELGPLFPTHSKSRRWVSNQDRSRYRSTPWIVASEMPRQQAFGHI